MLFVSVLDEWRSDMVGVFVLTCSWQITSSVCLRWCLSSIAKTRRSNVMPLRWSELNHLW